LLEPEKYFETKTKIDTIETPCSTIEWIIVWFLCKNWKCWYIIYYNIIILLN
jgi:hypothetical protein